MTGDPLASLKEAARLLPAVPSGRVLAALWALEGERGALKALRRTSLRIAGIRDAFDMIGVLEDVLEEAVQLVSAERGALAVIESGKIELLASRTQDGDEDVQVPHSLLEHVIQTAQGVVTTNVQDDPSVEASASVFSLEIRSVLAVPLRVRDAVIGALYVDTQIRERSFGDDDAATLETFAAQAGTAVTLARAIKLEQENYVSLVRTMLATLDARDPYTKGHSERVGMFTRALAARMAWGAGEQERAQFAGWVHDIGKIGIRDELLFKPGKLEPHEWVALKEHPVIGERILASAARGMEGILPSVRHHHERWDGHGYPDGVAGETTPLLARMVGIADAFDAMTTNRPYRPRRSWEEAIAVLHAEAGRQFDPHLVPLFVEAIEPMWETHAQEAVLFDLEFPMLETPPVCPPASDAKTI